MAARYLRLIMSESQEALVAEVDKGLDAASRTLAQLGALDAAEADRIGSSIDRVTSKLHELTPTA